MFRRLEFDLGAQNSRRVVGGSKIEQDIPQVGDMLSLPWTYWVLNPLP